MPNMLQRWRDMFVAIELSVLARTAAEIGLLRERQDEVSNLKLTDIVMRDPLMTMKVLRYLQQHRSRRRNADITTVGHALMMMGVEPFFTQFAEQRTLETQLAGDPAALRGALSTINRARHAALYAYDWAQFRHDLNPDEIMTAALLYEFAEVLLWNSAPDLMLDIADRMAVDPVLRIEDAELAVLGFRLADLNLALIQAWELPDLLVALIDYRQTQSQRALNVAHAVELARHSARGWNNLALLHDYFMVGKLLGLPLQAVERRVMDVSLQAAKDAAYYGVKSRPAQPLLPREPF